MVKWKNFVSWICSIHLPIFRTKMKHLENEVFISIATFRYYWWESVNQKLGEFRIFALTNFCCCFAFCSIQTRINSKYDKIMCVFFLYVLPNIIWLQWYVLIYIAISRISIKNFVQKLQLINYRKRLKCFTFASSAGRGCVKFGGGN